MILGGGRVRLSKQDGCPKIDENQSLRTAAMFETLYSFSSGC